MHKCPNGNKPRRFRISESFQVHQVRQRLHFSGSVGAVVVPRRRYLQFDQRVQIDSGYERIVFQCFMSARSVRVGLVVKEPQFLSNYAT